MIRKIQIMIIIMKIINWEVELSHRNKIKILNNRIMKNNKKEVAKL